MYRSLIEFCLTPRLCNPRAKAYWLWLLMITNLVICGQPCTAWSDSSNKTILGYHVPISPAEIPPMGREMQLRVVLDNTSNIETNLRLVGAKDGRFIDLAFPIGTINYESKPEFVIQLPAPFAEMSYQIVIHQPDGTITASKQFSIQRPCLEDYQIAIPEDSKSKRYRGEVAQLVAKAKRLEDESRALEQALSIVETMKSSS